MKEIILIVAEIINTMHDIILEITIFLGLDLTDKDLHLWIFGMIGICLFGCTHVFFKYLSKYGLTAISFVYTLMVIELARKTTRACPVDVSASLKGSLQTALFEWLY